jgi:hypothetical protein
MTLRLMIKLNRNEIGITFKTNLLIVPMIEHFHRTKTEFEDSRNDSLVSPCSDLSKKILKNEGLLSFKPKISMSYVILLYCYP